MATPRIFVSSTCYDLNEVRDNLYSFIESIGHIPVFSDKNDVFYHPDLHSHESCIKEIESCQIFVLIIGGRFGGNYVYDTTKSIVNAEYEAAKELELPIFTFIKREVHEDHRVFNHNKRHKPKLYQEFEYPAIEKQKDAVKVFEFIDTVRKSDINNAYFTFEFARNINDILKKQLAGLFYDFLWDRKRKKEVNRTNKLLVNLTDLSKKTEEIIENIYLSVDKKDAQAQLDKIANESKARKFWYLILQQFEVTTSNLTKKEVNEFSKINENETWVEYILRTARTEEKTMEIDDEVIAKVIFHTRTKKLIPFEALEGELDQVTIDLLDKLKENFKFFVELPESKRKELILDLE